MILKRLLDRLGDDVNPRVFLIMWTTLDKRIAATLFYMLFLSGYVLLVCFRAASKDRLMLEAGLGPYVLLFLLLFLFIDSTAGICRDEAVRTALKVMSPEQWFYGTWLIFYFESFYVWAVTMPFIVLASLASLSFMHLFLVVTTVCLAWNAFIMPFALISVNVNRGNKCDLYFALFAAPLIGVVPLSFGYVFVLFSMSDLFVTSCFFSLVFLSYVAVGYSLCLAHLRWNLKAPYREILVDIGVFAVFDIAVFGVGYALFQ